MEPPSKNKVSRFEHLGGSGSVSVGSLPSWIGTEGIPASSLGYGSRVTFPVHPAPAVTTLPIKKNPANQTIAALQIISEYGIRWQRRDGPPQAVVTGAVFILRQFLRVVSGLGLACRHDPSGGVRLPRKCEDRCFQELGTVCCLGIQRYHHVARAASIPLPLSNH